jgi:hypothetical protein
MLLRSQSTLPRLKNTVKRNCFPQITGNPRNKIAVDNEEDFMRSAPVDVELPRGVIALRIKAVELNRVL